MDWDARYLNGDTPWDKGYESPAFSEILHRIELSGQIWLPGAGLGYDARYVAERLPDSTVVGIDISKTAIERAKTFKNPRNLEFREDNIFTLDSTEQCDVWLEHTCYCAISPESRDDYKQAAQRHVKSGGLLAGVFFASGEKDPSDGPPFFSTASEIIARFSDTFTLIDSWKPRANYSGREELEDIFIFRRK